MHHPQIRRRSAIRAACVGLVMALTLVAGPLATPSSAGAPPTCSAPEGNARFVRFIYLNILFRCPSEADLTYWTGRLDAGLGRGAFALQVDMSDENLVQNNVAPLYGGILGRDATEAEISAGVAHIRANRWDGLLIAELAASDEYYANFEEDTESELTKDEQWLDDVYHNIVDRPIDDASREYWVGVLGETSTAATRLKVTRTLERSVENATSWIFGVYFGGVGRPPAGGDIEYWTGWLQGPGHWRAFQMWTSVLSSPEGYALAQTQPSPEESLVEGTFAKG